MNASIRLVFATLVLTSLSSAQSPGESPLMTNPASALVWGTNKALADGLKARVDLVNEIVGGQIKAPTGVARLKQATAASGLQVDRKADFAIGAIDVGRRLIVLQHTAAAEEFFRAAEQALAEGVRQTPDSAPRDKALILGKLAVVRGSYLNKRAQAKTDLDQAIALQPENKRLRRAKEMLLGGSVEFSKDQPKS